MSSPIEDATVIVPPDGRSARGRDEIRAAIAPLFALSPVMASVVVKKLEADGLALTHGRWTLAVTEHGHRSELFGLGTMVSRQGPDGTWRIVLDDPLANGWPVAADNDPTRPPGRGEEA